MIEENYRIGHGYDVHKLETGEKFVIGGIEIDHDKGAVGHSDADIIIHVMCDSFLERFQKEILANIFQIQMKNIRELIAKSYSLKLWKYLTKKVLK